MTRRKRFASVLPIVELRELYQERFADSRADVRYNPDANSQCHVVLDIEWPDWAGDEATKAIEDELLYFTREAISRIGASLSRVLAKGDK